MLDLLLDGYVDTGEGNSFNTTNSDLICVKYLFIDSPFFFKCKFWTKIALAYQ